MELRIDVRNPVVMAVVVVGLVGGGAWYGWKHPEKLKQVIRSNYDRSAIVDTEKMRVALEENLLVFLRMELLRAAADAGTIEQRAPMIEQQLAIVDIQARPRGYYRNRQDFYLTREDRHIDVALQYSLGSESGRAEGDAVLSRAGNWTLYSVRLVD